MSAVYKVTIALKGTVGTVLVEAADRAEAKRRALGQLASMGHVVTEQDVMLCRKAGKTTKVIGNRPAPTNGGKPA
jgi:hypothetical protein